MNAELNRHTSFRVFSSYMFEQLHQMRLATLGLCLQHCHPGFQLWQLGIPFFVGRCVMAALEIFRVVFGRQKPLEL